MRQDVEDVIKKFNVNMFGNKKNIELAESKLQSNETVFYLAPTNIVIYSVNTKKKEKLPGIFIITDRRMVFSYKVLFQEKTEIVNIEEIKDINCIGNGMTGGHIEISTITKTYDVMVSSNKEIMHKIQDTMQQVMMLRKESDNGKMSMSSADEIVKYKKLLDDGIISQDEFQAKKKQLLNI